MVIKNIENKIKLVLVGIMKDSIARKIARLIPDYRNQLFVQQLPQKSIPPQAPVD